MIYSNFAEFVRHCSRCGVDSLTMLQLKVNTCISPGCLMPADPQTITSVVQYRRWYLPDALATGSFCSILEQVAHPHSLKIAKVVASRVICTWIATLPALWLPSADISLEADPGPVSAGLCTRRGLLAPRKPWCSGEKTQDGEGQKESASRDGHGRTQSSLRQV